jgi:hypothetical protein
VEEEQDEREREEYNPPHRHLALNPQTVLVRVFEIMGFVRDLVEQRWMYFVIVGEAGMRVLEHRYLHRHHPVIRFPVLFRQRRFYDLLI